MRTKISPRLQKTAIVIALLCVIAAVTFYGAVGQGIRSSLLKHKVERILNGRYGTIKIGKYDTTYSVDLRGNTNAQDTIAIRNLLSANLSKDEFDHLHPHLDVNGKMIFGWDEISAMAARETSITLTGNSQR